MKVVLRWLVIALLLSAVVNLSNQPADEQKDFRPFLADHPRVVAYLEQLPPIKFHYTGSLIDSTEDPVKFWGFFVPRKAFHFLAYGLLGLAFVWAWRGSGFDGWKAWINALVLLTIVAGWDEWNQFRGGVRTGCKEDVILDITGFLVVGSIFAFVRALISKLKYTG